MISGLGSEPVEKMVKEFRSADAQPTLRIPELVVGGQEETP